MVIVRATLPTIAFSCRWQHAWPLLAACYYLMQKEEAERSFSYELVLRVRRDHIFSKRVPPVPHLFPSSALEGVIALNDDQVALASRSDAKTMLLVPPVPRPHLPVHR